MGIPRRGDRVMNAIRVLWCHDTVLEVSSSERCSVERSVRLSVSHPLKTLRHVGDQWIVDAGVCLAVQSLSLEVRDSASSSMRVSVGFSGSIPVCATNGRSHNSMRVTDPNGMPEAVSMG